MGPCGKMAEALLSGFTLLTKKLGYNGFRQEALTGATEYCEIKPKNVRTASSARNTYPSPSMNTCRDSLNHDRL